jgi:hypothetical protein
MRVRQYRMSIMALVASNDELLDQSKCVKMALAHDMAEAVVGDITPHDGVSKVRITSPDALSPPCGVTQEVIRGISGGQWESDA